MGRCGWLSVRHKNSPLLSLRCPACAGARLRTCLTPAREARSTAEMAETLDSVPGIATVKKADGVVRSIIRFFVRLMAVSPFFNRRSLGKWFLAAARL